MKSIEKLEKMVAGWLKPLPHLPVSFTKWLAANLWWIVLVGAVLSAFGVLAMIGGLITIISLLGAVTSFYGVYVGSSYTGWSVFASIVSLLFMIGVVALTAMAVTPLKLNSKKGWNILFMVILIQAASAAVGAILSYSVLGFISGIVFGVIGVAISSYFLYEVRSYFGETKKAATAPEKK